MKVTANGTNVFGMPLPDFSNFALPGLGGNEQALARTREGFEKIRAASEEMTETLREAYSGNARSATDYGLKVLEISNANAASALDFLIHLCGSKSATDVFTLSAAGQTFAGDEAADDRGVDALPGIAQVQDAPAAVGDIERVTKKRAGGAPFQGNVGDLFWGGITGPR